MKTKILFIAIFSFVFIFSQAQPRKGTFEFGGSGYWMKQNSEGITYYKIYDFNSNVNYFIFNHLSLGGGIHFSGGKKIDENFDNKFHQIYFAPIIEGYVLNRERYGISIKAGFNIALADTGEKLDKRISSYMFGPKLSWNITHNLSTHIWVAYRNTKWGDNTLGFRATYPSDNLDVRWGFSYFLHRKGKE